MAEPTEDQDVIPMLEEVPGKEATSPGADQVQETQEDTGVVNTLFPDGRPQSPTRKPDVSDAERLARLNQSRADKAEAELAKLRAELAARQTQTMPTEPSQGGDLEPSVPQGREQIQVPVPPKRLADYDPIAAMTDPQSPSFKYRMEREEYQGQLAEFVAGREIQRANEEAELRRQSQLTEARQQKAVAAKQQLMSKYGMPEKEALEFLQTMTRPESFSADELVSFFRFKTRKTSVDERQKTLQTRQGRTTVPPSLSSLGGQNEPQLTDEDTFNLGLLKGITLPSK